MGSSSPLVCHSCWESKENWNGPCQHAAEVFEQGVRKGREIVAAKPTCHFCRSKDVGVAKERGSTGKAFVKCFECGARGPLLARVIAPEKTRRESAIEGWNRVVPIRGLGPFVAAFCAGNEAKVRGDNDDKNPYSEGTQEWRAWKSGWDHVENPIRKEGR